VLCSAITISQRADVPSPRHLLSRRQVLAGAIAPQPRRGAPFVARRAVNLQGCA